MSVNQAFCQDRALAARATTPLLDLPESGIVVPLHYKDHGSSRLYPGHPSTDRTAEYIELRRRGATRAMCEEFSLEFDPESGIVAWVNQDIMEEFSGSAMQEGDQWKIYLGRRIQLDEEDTDGTFFIEGILEDGMIFVPKRRTPRWVTIKVSDTTWGTMPNPALEGPLEFEGTDDEDDEDDEEEAEGQYYRPIDEDPSEVVCNRYDADDDDDESEVVLEEGDEGSVEVSGGHPTNLLGISIADADSEDSEMDWEKESTDTSSCDSDFDLD